MPFLRVSVLVTAACFVHALAVHACAPADRPVLAEVLYDPAGDDSHREFVELFNPGTAAVSLAGLKFESGDGSAAGRWTLRWTGAAGDSIAPRGRFVIGGSLVEPPPSAQSELSLQNGPDAVRLVWPDGAIEVVGYGSLEIAEYFCGAPAVDAASGFSLARVPDDAHTGGNAGDFRAATPSPGRANQSARDLAWVAGSLATEPERPEATDPAWLNARVTNLGRENVPASAARIRGEVASGVVWFDRTLEYALAPGDTLALRIDLVGLVAGKHALACRITAEGDEAPENDADTLRVRVGPGPLEITEIQFHPAHDEGEWVEVLNRSDAAVVLASFRLADRADHPGRPSAGGGPVPPSAYALLAQDRAALLARYAGLDSGAVVQVSPWPSLNNSNDATGHADAVILREDDGVLCERYDYSALSVPAGVPIERRDGGAFWPAVTPTGSPLAPPPAPRSVPGRFDVLPRRVAASGTRFAWELPWPVARVSVDLYDLSGTRVAVAMPEAQVPGRGERVWVPDGIAPGLYVAVLRARAGTKGDVVHVTRALRLEGGAR